MKNWKVFVDKSGEYLPAIRVGEYELVIKYGTGNCSIPSETQDSLLDYECVHIRLLDLQGQNMSFLDFPREISKFLESIYYTNIGNYVDVAKVVELYNLLKK